MQQKLGQLGKNIFKLVNGIEYLSNVFFWQYWKWTLLLELAVSWLQLSAKYDILGIVLQNVSEFKWMVGDDYK